MTDRELLQQALDSLEWAERRYSHANLDLFNKPIEALRTRLAQPEPEPVAWLSPRNRIYRFVVEAVANGEQTVSPLYTVPPKKEWVGLTDEELTEMRRKIQEYMPMDYIQYGLTIQNAMEEKLKEKNDLG